MRRELEKMEGDRLEFIGTFERLGEKKGWKGSTDITVLLKDIVVADSGQHVASHLWFNYTKGFQALGLSSCSPGCRIKFRARVGSYMKGYMGRRDDVYKPVEVDYHLSRPTKIEWVVTNEDKT
jgi:hypothetical protein